LLGSERCVYASTSSRTTCAGLPRRCGINLRRSFWTRFCRLLRAH
jgi:hypothetical protein